MKTINLIIILVLLVSAACVPEKDFQDGYIFEKSIKLNGVSLGEKDYFSHAFLVDIIDTILVFSNVRPHHESQYFMNLYCLKNKKLIKSFGRKGKGPGEYLFIADLEVDTQYNQITIFDNMKLQIYQYDLDSLILMDNYIPKIINTPEVSDFTSFSELKRDTFIITGSSNDYFTIFQTKNSVTEVLVSNTTWPVIDYKISGLKTNISPQNLKPVFFGYTKACPYTGNFYTAKRSADLIGKFTIEGERLNDFSMPTYYIPWEDDDSYYQYNYCYFGLCVSKDHVYALYSGRRVPNFTNEVIQASYIHVFDKDLNPLFKYKLDQAISSFTFDQENNRFFGVDMENDSQIYVFDL